MNSLTYVYRVPGIPHRWILLLHLTVIAAMMLWAEET